MKKLMVFIIALIFVPFVNAEMYTCSEHQDICDTVESSKAFEKLYAGVKQDSYIIYETGEEIDVTTTHITYYYYDLNGNSIFGSTSSHTVPELEGEEINWVGKAVASCSDYYYFLPLATSEETGFLIKKVDEDGRPISGAQFDIYSKPEITYRPKKTAVFASGSTFNSIIRSIAGNLNNIKRFKKITNPSEEQQRSAWPLSDYSSDEEIYGYYENGVIYWWSDAGIIYFNENSSSMFSGLGKVDSIDIVKNAKTDNVTNMNKMFAGVGSDNPILNLDLSSFNTSKVTDMSYMFSGTGQRSALFSLNLKNFDTSKVTNMQGMFNSSGRTSTIYSLDLSSFDTSKVTNMSSMFSSSGDLALVYNLDLSKFDTSKVTNMAEMFSNAGEYSKIFSLDISNFDIRNVTKISRMLQKTNNENPTEIDISSFEFTNSELSVWANAYLICDSNATFIVKDQDAYDFLKSVLYVSDSKLRIKN